MCEGISHVVAIDGPAAAGKSSAAKRAADALGFRFLDTGAMYRAATWRALNAGVNLENPEEVVASTKAMQLEMEEVNGIQRVYVDGVDVTEAIRSPEVTRVIYKVDEIPEVRARMVELQRLFAAKGPTVAEGRDMGTVVFPKAQAKVYLEASLDERARRRANELAARGIQADWESLKREIHERDEKNRRRAVSPLRCAADAVVIDTTGMPLEEVVDTIVKLARKTLCSPDIANGPGTSERPTEPKP